VWLYEGLRLPEIDIVEQGLSGLYLTERAVRLVGDLFTVDGELLPVDADGERWHFFHPVGAEDAFDQERTRVERGFAEMALSAVASGEWWTCRLLDVQFRAERLAGRAIVGAVRMSPWHCFVTEPAMERIAAAGLRGADFDLVWEDDTPATPIGPPRFPVPELPPPRPYAGTGALYKVLVDGRSVADPACAWSLPEADGAPGAWVHADAPIDLGRHGLHVIDRDPYLAWPVWGMRAYEVEVGEQTITDGRLIATDRARLRRAIPAPAWWIAGERFIDEVLPTIRWFRPAAPPLPEWRVFVVHGPRLNPSAPGHDAADLEPRLEPEVQVSVWELLEHATAAGRKEAAEVQWGTAYRLAGDGIDRWSGSGLNGDLVANSAEVAEDVANVCLLRGVLSDVEIDPKVHRAAEARFEAWTLGYVPVADVNGKLFVETRDPSDDLGAPPGDDEADRGGRVRSG
jgi:hypothetical protein